MTEAVPNLTDRTDAVPNAFDNSYARLPGNFFTRTEPTPVEAPRLVRFNRPLAIEMGLDADALGMADPGVVVGGRTADVRIERRPLGKRGAPAAKLVAGH